MSDQLPPHDHEAERAILSSCLKSLEAVDDLAIRLVPDDFHGCGHSALFESILGLRNDHVAIDLVTVGDFLKRTQCFQDLGGARGLADIYEAVAVPANWNYYAEIVIRHAKRRAMIRLATDVLSEAYDPTTGTDESIKSAEDRLRELMDRTAGQSTKPVGEFVKKSSDRINARSLQKTDMWGVPTGFIDLDKKTTGLQDRELIVIGARPSTGKTAFMLSLAHKASVGESIPTLIISLEQGGIELADRLFAMHTLTDSMSIRTGNLTDREFEKLGLAEGVLDASPLFVDDNPHQTVGQIAANCRRQKRLHGIRLVLIDYLQLITPDDYRTPRHEQVSRAARSLKILARELEIPIVALAQLNRGSEDHEPRLSDLKESGGIEENADTVFLMHRPKDTSGLDQDGVIEINVAKQRNGPTGGIKLSYQKRFYKFDNYAPDQGWEPL